MTPELPSRLKPVGRAGETAYETTAPPELLGVFSVMAMPFV
jgi:hypothetical protein